MPCFLYLLMCWWTSRLVPLILNRTAIVTEEPVVLWEPLNFLIIGLRVAPTQFEYGMQTNSGKMYWVPTRIFWGKDRVCVKIGGPYSQGWSMWRIFPRVRMWRLPWGERRIGIAASKIKRRPWRLHNGPQMKKGGSTWMEKGESERWNRLSAGGKLDWVRS